MNDCRHNFIQCENKIYVKCSICGNIYNVERLVNALQNEVEKLTIDKGVDQLVFKQN